MVLGIGIIIILIAAVLLQEKPITPTFSSSLNKFNSSQELKSFLKSHQESQNYISGERLMQIMPAATTGASKSAESSESAEDYSTTNIQVQGVDEPDIVKNDGKYIYSVSGDKVIIVEAYPASAMKIISEIDLNKSIDQIFLNKDKLIIFSQGYERIVYDNVRCLDEVKCGGYSEYKTLVYIYDISDREKPVLERNISASGSYVDSRMIGDYVYVVSSKYAEPEPVLPVYEVNGATSNVKAEDVYYFDYEDTSFVFTSVMAINTDKDEFNSRVYLTGGTSEIYVSNENIYLTFTKRISYSSYNDKLINEAIVPILQAEQKKQVEDILNSNEDNYKKLQEVMNLVYNYSNSLIGDEKADFDKRLDDSMKEFEFNINKETEKTVINKIGIDGKEINYAAQGQVPGHVLNQFSMDEYDNNFRIATTTGEVWEGNSLNHLFVLDKDLRIIGSVEDLAQGEKIYSARFQGARAYIVTFKKVDPLFVIDLSEAANPKVLGYLKIPGYSDYLHPYDENHVIGIGKEAVDASEEDTSGRGLDFAWYQGVKISLFDITDVEHPVEKAKFNIGDRGTDSPALYDHKAFLFDKEKGLLVIPINLAEINKSRYGNESIPPTAYGDFVWEGAYVLNIDLQGISLRGKITHDENFTTMRYYYGGGKYSVKRSLYMDDVLYTISNGKIKANNLENIEEISSVELPFKENYYYPGY